MAHSSILHRSQRSGNHPHAHPLETDEQNAVDVCTRILFGSKRNEVLIQLQHGRTSKVLCSVKEARHRRMHMMEMSPKP